MKDQDSKMYDLIIIGAGPAGITASLFARRQGLDVLVFNNPGQPSNLAVTHYLENWPGAERVSGFELLTNMTKQVKKLGVKIINEKAVSIKKSSVFSVKTEKGTYESRTLILAMGLQHRKGNIAGEEKFFGRGVSYCTVCDGPLFNGKDVAVIGGGDSAAKGALTLREMGARDIYLIHKRDQLRAEKLLQDKLTEKNIRKELDTLVDEITGGDFVETLRLNNVKTGALKNIKVSGVFIEIGYIPLVELVKDLKVELDKNGFVKTDCEKNTSIHGLFAAGDISTGSLKQNITACADGATAAISAYRYLKDQ